MSSKVPGSLPGLTDATVFEAPDGVTCLGDGRAHVACVSEIVCREPIAAVDENDDRMRTRALWKAQFAELVPVIAVGQTRTGGWRRKIENALCFGQQSAGRKRSQASAGEQGDYFPFFCAASACSLSRARAPLRISASA